MIVRMELESLGAIRTYRPDATPYEDPVALVAVHEPAVATTSPPLYDVWVGGRLFGRATAPVQVEAVAVYTDQVKPDELVHIRTVLNVVVDQAALEEQADQIARAKRLEDELADVAHTLEELRPYWENPGTWTQDRARQLQRGQVLNIMLERVRQAIR